MTTENPLHKWPFATYYVVPVNPDDGKSESVCYYQQKKGEDFWTKVDAKSLNSCSAAQDCRSELVCLVQASAEDVAANIEEPLNFDPRVTLFAGVAKTLTGDYLLPNTYLATEVCGRPSMVLTVFNNAPRALILVFVKKPDSSEIVQQLQLIASTDPQIINSTN